MRILRSSRVILISVLFGLGACEGGTRSESPVGVQFSETEAEVAGAVGAPTDAPSELRLQSDLGPGSINITPISPTYVSNCIPFGNNTMWGFTGFIYRNVPAFELRPGMQFAFDMGSTNDVDIRRNIYFATANKNPAPPPPGLNVPTQGIFAASAWTQVVSDAQTPLNPQGNTVKDDYELVYTAEAAFSFPGGGLIVGFGGSPPGSYADFGCQQVLVRTDNQDASGFFYSRFYNKTDRTPGVLDDIGAGGSGVELGGIVIQVLIPVEIDIKPGSDPNSINCGNRNGVIAVAILTNDNFDATTVDHTTMTFEGASEAHVDMKTGEARRHEEDVDYDGDIDLVFHFRRGDTNLTCASTEGMLAGETFDGVPIEGTDAVRMIGEGDCWPPPSGLVGWWPGDGNALDIVGDNHGALEGGAAIGAGLVGEAFSLDGQDDFVNVPHSDDLNIGAGDFTVDLWVNFRALEGEQVMIEKWIQKGLTDPGNPIGWSYTKLNDNTIRFTFSNTDLGEHPVDVVPPSIPIDTWIHAAATRANDTYTLFWNGEPIASQTLDYTYDLNSSSSLKFGHRGNPDDTPGSDDWRGFYVNGLIDEVEFFNRALSAEEIQAIFEAGSAGKCKG